MAKQAKKAPPTLSDGRVARRLMPPRGLGTALATNGAPIRSDTPRDERPPRMGRGYVRAVVPYTQQELAASGRTHGGHIQVIRRRKTVA